MKFLNKKYLAASLFLAPFGVEAQTDFNIQGMKEDSTVNRENLFVSYYSVAPEKLIKTAEERNANIKCAITYRDLDGSGNLSKGDKLQRTDLHVQTEHCNQQDRHEVDMMDVSLDYNKETVQFEVKRKRQVQKKDGARLEDTMRADVVMTGTHPSDILKPWAVILKDAVENGASSCIKHADEDFQLQPFLEKGPEYKKASLILGF